MRRPKKYVSVQGLKRRLQDARRQSRRWRRRTVELEKLVAELDAHGLALEGLVRELHRDLHEARALTEYPVQVFRVEGLNGAAQVVLSVPAFAP